MVAKVLQVLQVQQELVHFLQAQLPLPVLKAVIDGSIAQTCLYSHGTRTDLQANGLTLVLVR